MGILLVAAIKYDIYDIAEKPLFLLLYDFLLFTSHNLREDLLTYHINIYIFAFLSQF